MNTASNRPALEFPRELFARAKRGWLAQRLFEYARERRWYRAKARTVQGYEIADRFMLDGPLSDGPIAIVLLAITYEGGARELYVVPLVRVDRAAADALKSAEPHAIVAPLDGSNGGALVDGLATGHAASALLGFVRNERAVKGDTGELRGKSTALFRDVAGVGPLTPTVHGAEQTNSTIAFGERVLFKVYRQLTAGDNPELEVGRFLTDHCKPPCAPRVLGDIAYRDAKGVVYGLAIAHEFVPNDGDAWTFVLREVRSWLEAPRPGKPTVPPANGAGLGALVASALAAESKAGAFASHAETLGRRTAELHLALASDARHPDFAPEALSTDDRAAMAARASAMLGESLEALAKLCAGLPPASRRLAERLLEPASRRTLEAALEQFRDGKGAIVKTRTHGDLHLGQVLVRGDDFMIIDFEGEPARPLAERRAKSSPLRDVMGMARSFDYAPEAVLREPSFHGVREERLPWARQWTADATRAYLRGYLLAAGRAPFIPEERDELVQLLNFYQLEKVIYEIGYEVNNRPDWVEIPLRGLASIALSESRR